MTHKTTYIVGITGGIGAGKSVVSEILRAMGHDVYDCDRQARMIMNTSCEIKSLLSNTFGTQVIDSDGNVNRKILGEIVFANEYKLKQLNDIVHGAVKKHLLNTIGSSTKKNFFFETAILQESGLDEVCDEVWIIEAPLEMRINRVMNRNSLSRAEVMARIEAQSKSLSFCGKVNHIINDGENPILPNVHRLLGEIDNALPPACTMTELSGTVL